MKNILKVSLASLFLTFAACSNNENYRDDIMIEPVPTPQEVSHPLTDAAAPKTEYNSYHNLKIIKNANVRFRIKNLDSCTTQTQRLILKWNGYVANMQYLQDDYKLENRMMLKVPAKNFDYLLLELTELADFVDYKNISTQDVTQEYVDLTTRLATKKQVKARYDQILRNKAKTVEEVLQTEEKLRVLQEEIEAAEGRLKYLSNQVSLSSIQLDFYQKVAIKKERESYAMTFGDKAINSLGYGWSFIKGAILVLLTIWPLLLLFPFVIYGVKWLRKK